MYRRAILLIILLMLLVHTRFVGLDWGLPYPMHPDERNMANVIEQLKCNSFPSIECFNPHFFAYGQLPLYIGFFLVKIFHLFTGSMVQVITFAQATMSLRVISAVSSIITSYLMLMLIKELVDGKKAHKHDSGKVTKHVQTDDHIIQFSTNSWLLVAAALICIFSPVLIQFAHFGTTESLLMMFYTALVYLAVRLLQKTIKVAPFAKVSGILFGLAIATKISAVPFIAIPLVAVGMYYLYYRTKWWLIHGLFALLSLSAYSLLFFLLGSPFNIIALPEFLGSMSYESSVGLGEYIPFYTRQFVKTIPVLFQFSEILPYALGLPVLIAFILGFFLLPWKKEYILLRISFLIIFIPNAFVFAKWTRFIAPAYPIAIIIAALLVIEVDKTICSLLKKHAAVLSMGVGILTVFAAFLLSLPGIAYLSVYRSPDIRFTASAWMFKNIPPGSYILSETANVVDVPIPYPNQPTEEYIDKHYRYISFNSYDLDTLPQLQDELQRHIYQADYIIVPSRRVFWNHTCIRPTEDGYYDEGKGVYKNEKCEHLLDTYPHLHDYYKKLFSSEYGFEQVAEFTAYPRVELFGKTIYEIPDESAEETWTVFDHPVIRVYKRIE